MQSAAIGLLAALGFCSCKQQPEKHIPSDPHATESTKALYSNLCTIERTGTMFGHQDATLYGIGWKDEKGQSDVKKVTGDYPAIYGWELGHIETGNSVSLDSVAFDKIREEAVAARARGGINTISWHLDNPLTGGTSWDLTNNQTVASILPGGSHHAIYISWLDRMATYLNSFQERDGTKIPLLFRPFHEHSGSWFWWGKNHCTVEQYTTLYRFTIDYLRETKQLHHLLIIYSPDRAYSETDYFERYPGDEYVDILGIDWYHRPESDSSERFIEEVSNALMMIRNAARKKNKPLVFSETGQETLSVANWFTRVLYPAIEQASPAYVLVWRNAHERPNHYYAPYPGHPACDDFNLFKQKENILFESELPNMYQ